MCLLCKAPCLKRCIPVQTNSTQLPWLDYEQQLANLMSHRHKLEFHPSQELPAREFFICDIYQGTSFQLQLKTKMMVKKETKENKIIHILQTLVTIFWCSTAVSYLN